MTKRHLVCLSFDFDAMSGFIARKMMTPTPVSRGEFGAVGVERLLALLGERGPEREPEHGRAVAHEGIGAVVHAPAHRASPHV